MTPNPTCPKCLGDGKANPLIYGVGLCPCTMLHPKPLTHGVDCGCEACHLHTMSANIKSITKLRSTALDAMMCLAEAALSEGERLQLEENRETTPRRSTSESGHGILKMVQHLNGVDITDGDNNGLTVHPDHINSLREFLAWVEGERPLIDEAVKRAAEL